MSVNLLSNLKLGVGWVKKMMTFRVVDIPPKDNNYELILKRAWSKHTRAKHDLGTNQINLHNGKEKTIVNVQWTLAVPTPKTTIGN